MRLIDADALKEALEVIQYNDIDDLTRTEQLINNATTVDTYTIEDIQEVRENALILGAKLAQRPKGEWITGGKDVTGQYFYDEFICNQCFVVVTDKSNFCPKCGADMRKGGAE